MTPNDSEKYITRDSLNAVMFWQGHQTLHMRKLPSKYSFRTKSSLEARAAHPPNIFFAKEPYISTKESHLMLKSP